MRLRAIGEPSERAAFAAELWLRGVRVDKITLNEAVQLRLRTRAESQQGKPWRDEYREATDLVASEANNPEATYSIMLKRLRQLYLLSDWTGAQEMMCRIRARFPDVSMERHDPICEAEHQEVLRWQKT